MTKNIDTSKGVDYDLRGPVEDIRDAFHRAGHTTINGRESVVRLLEGGTHDKIQFKIGVYQEADGRWVCVAVSHTPDERSALIVAGMLLDGIHNRAVEAGVDESRPDLSTFDVPWDNTTN